MVKRVLLHVGLGKTGTGTIQATLAENRTRLARLGAAYPGDAIAHHDLLAMVHQKGPKHAWFSQRNITPKAAHDLGSLQMSAIRSAAAEGASVILLSSEHFQNLRAEHIAQMDHQIDALGYQLETLCYMRSPLSHTASRIQQGVKMGNAHIAQLLDRPYLPLARDHCEAALMALGPGRVHLRKMENAKRNGLARDLLLIAGLQPAYGTFEDRRRNTGLCHDAVYLLDAINKIDAHAPAGRPLFNRHRQELFEMTGRKFTLPPDVARRIQTESRVEQAWLFRHFKKCYPLEDIVDVPSHWQEIEWAKDTVSEVSLEDRAAQDWHPLSQAG